MSQNSRDGGRRDFSNFRLETERLCLVPQSMKYLDSTHEYASDRQNMRYMMFLPNDSIEDTKQFLVNSEAEWKSPIPCDFECAVLRGGEHIGGISVTLNDGFAELGWCLKKSAQGNGYAQEAAAALIQWTNKTFGVTLFIAHCDTENAPSWTTMENLGMKRVCQTGGRRNKLAPDEEREEFTYELNIADEWVTFSRFDMKNLPQVVQVVLPLWAPPSDDENFVRMDVEFIVRNNIYQPKFSFQLADKRRSPENELLSAAFFTLKDDANTAREWLSEQAKNVTASQKVSLEMVQAYLEYMDKKALSFMNGDDIKLSLYVSRKRGMGAALLEKVLPRLAAKGYKNLYLWTDSDCNWKWYVNHGYELVSQEVYEPFSEPSREYTTFVFKKPLV